ncbi:ribonuclease HI family protein [Chloroflexota bacterium]
MRQLRAHPVPTLSKKKKTMGTKKVVIHSDGASRGNPGLAAIGATIKDEEGKLIARISRHIGTTTNNQAEYRAIIAALEEAVRLNARQVELNSDSELVVKQMKGEYRVKNAALKPLYQRAKQLQNSLEDFTITHIPRQQNTEADSLANRALGIA